jgi:sensor histidine kinase YesM
MTDRSRTRWIIPTIQIIFWAGLLVAFISFASAYTLPRAVILWHAISEVGCQVLFTYFNIYVLMPRFFKNRKYVLYFSIVMLALVSLVLIRAEMLHFLTKENKMNFSFYYGAIIPLAGFFFMSSTFWITTGWFESRRKEVELTNSQLDTELKFLKLQLNPHFLFNTLNNIYSLTLLKNDRAPDAVMKLSEMMRHMIYDSQDKFISLTKEVDFIENFIDLQKIKAPNPPMIKFTKDGIRDNYRIAPLIFLAFLENSFKHGPQGAIEIELSVKDSMLHFMITNEIPKYKSTQSEKSGVGLANVKKRLELIYPNKHELRMNSHDQIFRVNLSINVL